MILYEMGGSLFVMVIAWYKFLRIMVGVPQASYPSVEATPMIDK